MISYRLSMFTAALAATLALCGCSTTSADPSTSGDPTPPDAGKPSALFTCDETDLAPLSFSGPEFDKKAGHFTGAQPATYLVHTTWLETRKGQESAFFKLTGAVVGRLQTQPGLLGYSLATSKKCGTARTMGVWRDQKSVDDFVVSKEHTAAMAAVDDVATDYAIYVWEQALDGAPPSWTDVVKQLRDHEEAAQ